MGKLNAILRKGYENVYGVIKDYSEPKIFHGGDDYLWGKQPGRKQPVHWYVYYSYRNPETGKLERQTPIKLDANRIKSKTERLKYLNKVRKILKDLLESGDYTPKNWPHVYPEYIQEEVHINRIGDSLDYALEVKQGQVADVTYRGYVVEVKRFKQFLQRKALINKDVREFSKSDINNYLNTEFKNLTNKTRNNGMAALSALFTVLQDEDYIDFNFIKHTIKKLKENPEKYKRFSESKSREIMTYLEEIRPDLRFFIDFFSMCAIRMSDACRLRVENIDFESMEMFIETKTGKGKVRTIPYILIDDLRNYITDEPKALVFSPGGCAINNSSVETVRTYWGKLFMKIIKPKFGLAANESLNSFRPTRIHAMYQSLIKKHGSQEIALSELQAITGHDTRTALMKYLRGIGAMKAKDFSDLLK